jgi:hypothetical protein
MVPQFFSEASTNGRKATSYWEKVAALSYQLSAFAAAMPAFVLLSLRLAKAGRNPVLSATLSRARVASNTPTRWLKAREFVISSAATPLAIFAPIEADGRLIWLVTPYISSRGTHI